MKTFKIETLDTEIIRKYYFVDHNSESEAREFLQKMIDNGDNLYDILEESHTVQSDEVIQVITQTQQDGSPL